MKRATAIVLCAVALLGACYRGNPSGPKVAIAGDSITVLQDQWGELDAYLVDTYYFDVAAISGQRIDQMLPSLASLLGSREGTPTRIVVNLGTNDMLQNYSSWEQSFDDMWAMIADRSCVVYVTVREVTDRTLGPAINRKIQDTAAAQPNVRVFDWNAYLNTHSTQVTPLLYDPVHPTPDGADAARPAPSPP